jgi:splicing factor 3B subunit 2
MVKQKLRERMNPKQGKLDIDYGVLHDSSNIKKNLL